MLKNKKKLIILFIGILVVLYIVIYAFPNVTGALKKTIVIEYGGIQVTDDVTAYFIRNESLYLANKSGAINYYVEEGEQVRKGIKVLDLSSGAQTESESKYQEILDKIQKYNGGESIYSDDMKRINSHIQKLQKQLEVAFDNNEGVQASRLQVQLNRISQKIGYINATDDAAREAVIKRNVLAGNQATTPAQYISQSNGVISFHIDGYESEFTPENIPLLSKDKVENLEIKVKNIKRKTAYANEPLYKVVDNTEWYVAFWVKHENIVKYEKGKAVTLKLPSGEVEGKIYDIVDDDGEWMVVLKFNRYYEEFAQIRKTEAVVITSDYKGLTIPNESITTSGGQPGVYVKEKSGEYTFRPIQIITSDGEWSLVEVSYFYTDAGATKVETVNIYDEILKKPN